MHRARGIVNKPKGKAFAQSIEALYRGEYLRHPFPHEERVKLEKLRPGLTEDLMDHFEFYFDFISSYTSSATQLHQRPRAELREALAALELSFYDTYPQYAPLSQLITDVDSPSLSRELAVADKLRHNLIRLINEICSVE